MLYNNHRDTVRSARDMDDSADRTDHLTCERSIIHPGERAEGFQPRRDVSQSAGVDRAGPAFVARVQRAEQFADLLAATLPHDQPVRPHAQRLTQQTRERNAAGALEVRLSRLETNVVRVNQELCSNSGNESQFLSVSVRISETVRLEQQVADLLS